MTETTSVSPSAGPGGLRARWVGLRNRLIENPRFQRFSAQLPFVRRIVRRETAALFDIVAGFVYSQILDACVRLDLFAALADGPRTVASLAKESDLSPDAMERLLRAAAALRLTEHLGADLYALGTLGAALRGNAGLVSIIEHHRMLYADLADPIAVLRGNPERTHLGTYWGYGGDSDPKALALDRVAQYSALMAKSQAMISALVLDAYDFGQHRLLLDIGGGAGAFLAAAGRRHPTLTLALFDLPAVAKIAASNLAQEGLGSRTLVHEGSFFDDELPMGADIATLVRILHDHGDDAVRKILLRAARALKPGGTLVIAEPMAGTPGGERIAEAYFGLYLGGMGQGRARSPVELGKYLRDAGFRSFKTVQSKNPLIVQLVIATK